MKSSSQMESSTSSWKHQTHAMPLTACTKNMILKVARRRSCPRSRPCHLAVAELLSSAANSTTTRKYLAGQQAVLDWIDIASVPRNTSSAQISNSKRKSDAVAVVAGLADIKIYRAIASEAAEGLSQAATSQPTSQQDHIRKIQQSRDERRRKDESLYRTVQRELLATVSRRPFVHKHLPS